MKCLGRDAAELTALADHLAAHGLVLEMHAGPLPGIHDATGPGKLLFAFFAAMAEAERENIRESTEDTAVSRAGQAWLRVRPSPRRRPRSGPASPARTPRRTRHR
ncbi:recombinase family protein [Streptomyces sp. NPDC058221]|uniref:recombinase family protein n=1 Tax=Streptomyces sp. NPDC058221 TaxID=3346388 RepID=UPI0036F01816